MSFFLYLDENLHVGRWKDATFDLIFVNGHHSFDYTFFDLMRSSLFLRPGGALVVDNIEQPGPAAAVRFFLDRHTHWHLFQSANVRRNEDFSFHPRANSAIILAPDGSCRSCRTKSPYKLSDRSPPKAAKTLSTRTRSQSDDEEGRRHG